MPLRRLLGKLTKDQEESKTKSSPPLSPRPSTTQTIQSAEPFKPQDLWQAAYNQLEEEKRRILSTAKITAIPIDKENQTRPEDLISEVIRLTKEQYEEYLQNENGKIRTCSKNIINAALSFKDVIGAASTFDPTQHAASAWAIVSLGLTMTKNHRDRRDALFESSDYLADVLTQCAFVEQNFYHDGKSGSRQVLGKVLIRLYRAILNYTALVRKTQSAGKGKKLLDCVSAITEHPLTELKALIEKEKENLRRRIELDEYLRRGEEAENLLDSIDQHTKSMKELIEQSGLVNLRVAEEAFYNSYVSQHEDFCLPDTRTELQNQILEWAQSNGKFIFWLNGMAGTGKSTIARTVAQSFEKQGLLGASFFFKRGEADRGNAKYLVSTITRQLVTRHRQLVPDVLNAIKTDPNIASKFLSEQSDKLLYQPLMKLHLDQPTTIVIVIDALDECDGEDDMQVILRLLFKLQEIKSIRLRVFLTSRPELPIRLGFKQDENHQDLVLHELPAPVVEHDIRVFLEYKLSKLQHERSLPQDWPGNDNVERLVQMAAPLFIFAATACRFIKEGTHPKKRLQKLLEFQVTTTATQMDKIYLPILNQLINNDKDDSNELVNEFQDIVGVIILLSSPLSIESLSQLLQISADDISELLDPLHSVLSVPSNGEAPRKDIDPQIINQHLTADLQYSCRYWVYHLKQSDGRISEFEILCFLKKHFLHWLEALALFGSMSDAVEIIDTLISTTWTGIGAEISDFLYDAKRFALQNTYIAGIAPLQAYCSGLVFAPAQSIVKKTFFSEIGIQIQRLPVLEDYWSPNLQTLEGHLDSVNSVAFSPDGRTLASGSLDRTIKLWDTTTGIERQTLEGHSGWVYSVAFSPDGRTLASGSADRTIKLWDTITGTERQTLEGHSDWVYSVAFSPDGRTLASGSTDRTIKLWDTTTGTERQILEGRSGPVNSVAFSPDGRTLASGSADRTIKLWDTITGIERQTLEGHSGPVNSVAFSPDGRTLASGSLENTIKLWDTTTGIERQTLEGHSGPVYSVAFSPDGRTLASGSLDNTIKLWDTTTGTERQTLEGHSDWVYSVAFSPDGHTLASGSADRTIKLWDTTTGTECQTLEGHSGTVYSVAFSPDGRTLASGSLDNTIKLWDTTTGTERQTLEGHSRSIQTVLNEPTSHSQVCLSNAWISSGGENLLWLPAEYRSFYCHTVTETTIALGYDDGRVCFIGLHILN
ncbi:hypothetical protein RU639_013746 [Aspergillus parasiticus]